MKKEVLRFEKVVYKENGHIVLDGLYMHLFAGEIMELIYMDNIEKKAVVKLLGSNLPISYGQIYLYEKLVNSEGYVVCRNNKIAVIQQKRSLIESMSVAENVFVIRGGFRKNIINRKMLEKQFDRFMEREKIPLSIRGYMQTGKLSTYELAVLELLKAVIMDIKLVVVCEVENHLSEIEKEAFFRIMAQFAKKGFSFVYLCNRYEKMPEGHVQTILMEDGKISKLLKDQDADKYFSVISNNKINQLEPKKCDRKILLSFQNVFYGNIKHLNLHISQGECLAIRGIDNLIIEDIIKLMNGEVKQRDILGEITYKGKKYPGWKYKNAIRSGIAFIPEDPVTTILYHEISFMDNFCFLLDEKKTINVISKSIRKNIKQKYFDVLGEVLEEQNMSCVSLEDLYKLIYYSIHLCNPDIVFCVRPFAGADFCKRHLILSLIEKLREKGITVVLLLTNISGMEIPVDRTIYVYNNE